MWNIENHFKAKLGGNYYIDTPTLIAVKGKSLFSIKRRDEDGLLAIDFDVYDAKGDKVATIRNAHVVQGNKEDYEIRKEFHRYWVTERATGRVVCDVRQKGKAEAGSELEISVDLYTKSGFRIIADPDKTNIAGGVMKGMTFQNCGTAIGVE